MGMFGTKAGMTQIFTPEGLAIPATVIALEDGNVVTQVHTEETSGYNAVQIGYQECAERKLTKPEAGHCKKVGAKPMRRLREFKVSSPPHITSCSTQSQHLCDTIAIAAASGKHAVHARAVRLHVPLMQCQQ